VFPARYELNSYIVYRKRLVSKRLRPILAQNGGVRIWKVDMGGTRNKLSLRTF
jgi:hypothetical protein